MDPLSVLKRVQVLDIPFLGLSEEELDAPPSLDLETELHEVEGDRETIVTAAEPIRLDGFIDGAQRTVRWKVCRTPEGARVPIFVSAIAAGLLWRDVRGYPLIGFKRIWLVLLGPFSTMERDPTAEERVATTLGALRQEEIYADPLRLLQPEGAWIVADTSITGLEGTGAVISQDDLFKEGLLRSRALGRIAHLRIYLELALLIGVRASQPDAPTWLVRVMHDHPVQDRLRYSYNPHPFLLVDGPLLLTAKRRERLRVLLQPPTGTEVERFLLTRAVGLIKTHRLRPRNPERILNLRLGERSRAYDLTREVDLGGREVREDLSGDEALYPSTHLTFYLRMAENPASALHGLVRVDLHRAALNPDGGLIPEERQPLSRVERAWLDRIAAGVYRERVPRLTGKLQPAPIALLEESLHRAMPPSQVLQRLEKGV